MGIALSVPFADVDSNTTPEVGEAESALCMVYRIQDFAGATAQPEKMLSRSRHYSVLTYYVLILQNLLATVQAHLCIDADEPWRKSRG